MLQWKEKFANCLQQIASIILLGWRQTTLKIAWKEQRSMDRFVYLHISSHCTSTHDITHHHTSSHISTHQHTSAHISTSSHRHRTSQHHSPLPHFFFLSLFQVASFMTVWNKLQPEYAANMWNEALNKRLGTEVSKLVSLYLSQSLCNMS